MSDQFIEQIGGEFRRRQAAEIEKAKIPIHTKYGLLSASDSASLKEAVGQWPELSIEQTAFGFIVKRDRVQIRFTVDDAHFTVAKRVLLAVLAESSPVRVLPTSIEPKFMLPVAMKDLVKEKLKAVEGQAKVSLAEKLSSHSYWEELLTSLDDQALEIKIKQTLSSKELWEDFLHSVKEAVLESMVTNVQRYFKKVQELAHSSSVTGVYKLTSLLDDAPAELGVRIDASHHATGSGNHSGYENFLQIWVGQWLYIDLKTGNADARDAAARNAAALLYIAFSGDFESGEAGQLKPVEKLAVNS